MQVFEFIMVLVSIVIGLGIAEILKGVAWTLRHHGGLRGYWVHSALAGAIFLAHLQTWWESWGFRDNTEWSFVGLLFLLGGPTGLYLLAHLLYPEEGVAADLRAYYYEVARPLYAVAAGTVLVSMLFRPVVFADVLLQLPNLTSFLFMASFVVLAVTKRPRVHEVLAPVNFTALVLDVVLVNPTIGA